MGCASSQAIDPHAMEHAMQKAMMMQQEQLKKQQKMMASDPHCKNLMDNQAQTMGKMMQAMQSGDGTAMNQAQMEMMGVMKDPKFMQMMMPSKATLRIANKRNFHKRNFQPSGTNPSTAGFEFAGMQDHHPPTASSIPSADVDFSGFSSAFAGNSSGMNSYFNQGGISSTYESSPVVTAEVVSSDT